MKIILKKDVANLGDAGDIVEVKTGYALNYLVPQGFAAIGTPSAITACGTAFINIFFSAPSDHTVPAMA